MTYGSFVWLNVPMITDDVVNDSMGLRDYILNL